MKPRKFYSHAGRIFEILGDKPNPGMDFYLLPDRTVPLAMSYILAKLLSIYFAYDITPKTLGQMSTSQLEERLETIEAKIEELDLLGAILRQEIRRRYYGRQHGQ